MYKYKLYIYRFHITIANLFVHGKLCPNLKDIIRYKLRGVRGQRQVSLHGDFQNCC